MTDEQIGREARFQAAMAVLDGMLEKGVITRGQHAEGKALMLARHRPAIGSLLAGGTCYSRPAE